MTNLTKEDVLDLARERAAERFARGDWASSERDYQLLVRLDGTCADDLARLGAASVQLGSVAYGAVCLSKALELDPDHTAARLQLGEALIRLGSFREGIELTRQVWEARTSDVAGEQTATQRRAAAVLAIARYAAENPPSDRTPQKVFPSA